MQGQGITILRFADDIALAVSSKELENRLNKMEEA